jgi:hypothetical protein
VPAAMSDAPSRVVLVSGPSGTGIAAHCAVLASAGGYVTFSTSDVPQLGDELGAASGGGDGAAPEGETGGAKPSGFLAAVDAVCDSKGPVVLLQVMVDDIPDVLAWAQTQVRLWKGYKRRRSLSLVVVGS